MAANPDFDTMRDEFNKALTEVLARHDQSMPTRWVLLCEVFNADDGDRALWQFASAEMKAWETLGLLVHAVHTEEAETVAHQIRGGGDE